MSEPPTDIAAGAGFVPDHTPRELPIHNPELLRGTGQGGDGRPAVIAVATSYPWARQNSESSSLAWTSSSTISTSILGECSDGI